jgi:glutamate-ammonia-ligase adenylyltransferase
MLQLTHGQSRPKLRRLGTVDALKALRDEKILHRDEYRLLSEGYLFLRRLDHRLRLERDQSIDAFEAEAGRLDGIAKALGYTSRKLKRGASNSGRQLLRDYRTQREKIRACYERYFMTKAKR